MKNRQFISVFLLGIALTGGSCGNFLDETADKTGNAYIYHMDQLYGLTGQANLYLGSSDPSAYGNEMDAGMFMQEQYLMGDGVSVSPEFYSKGMPTYFMQSPYAYSLYSWEPYLLKNDNTIPTMTWLPAYERIYVFNTVLENMDKVVQTTAAIRSQVEGEACFGRAFYHFMLLTQYCQWNEEAPGIGYREDTNPDGIPARETVGYTLERIYKDLEQAEKALTAAGRTAFDFEFNTRPTVPTVQALRARIDLYRGNYESALTYAEKALEGNCELVDVATDPNNELIHGGDVVYEKGDGSLDMENVIPIVLPNMNLGNQAVITCPEVILPCMSSDMITCGVPISEAFYNLFTDKTNDARWIFYYANCVPLLYATGAVEYGPDGINIITQAAQQWLKPWDICSFWHFSSRYGPNQVAGMTTAEMYLIKAECLARGGKEGDAAEVLKKLRRTRFTDPEAANAIGGSLQEVLDERAREMGPFWRFFDIKRLNGAENAGIEIRRKILSDPTDPSSVTELVIPANDPRWALPFYTTECNLMGWEQNEGWE